MDEPFHEPDPQMEETADWQKAREEEIASCIAECESPDPHQRSAAVKRLCQLKEGVPQIIHALFDLNAFVRAEAATAVGFVLAEPTPEVEDLLFECLQDANTFVRSAAILSIGNLKITSAIPQLQQILAEESNSHVLGRTFKALARLGAKENLETLRGYLEHSNLFLVGAAAEALGLLEDNASTERIIALFERMTASPQKHSLDVCKACLLALGRIKDDATAPFLARVATTQVGLRSVAIEALSYLNIEPVATELFPLLLEPGDSVRTRTVSLVVSKKILSAIPTIHRMMRSTNTNVRESGVLAAYWLNDLSAKNILYEMCLSEKSPILRANVVSKYILMFGMQGIEELLSLASDPNAKVRHRLVSGICDARLISQNVASAMQQLLQDELPEIAQLAQMVLDLIPEVGLQPGYSAEKKPDVLLPLELRAQASHLRELLAQWQQKLPALAEHENQEGKVKIDQALETLISELKKL